MMASVSTLKRLTDRPLPWFRFGIIAVFVVSIALRYWGLSRFNTLVFDEVYYANFAVGYLNGIPEFGGHPPLSNYIIAIGIWIAQHTPLGNDPVKNDLTGMLLSPFSYRWINAFIGSFIPLVIAGLAYQLSHRRSYALIAGIFAAADGLFLVESRYALNNIYLVLFGLLGHWFLLLALDSDRLKRWGWLTLSGVAFGSSVAIKWNGVSFLIGAYLIWIAAWIIRFLHSRAGQPTLEQTPLQRLTQLNVGHFALFFALIPFITYWLTWIPYLLLDPTISFWDWQAKILDYHHRVGGMDAHAYCSYWFTWILMLRPVAYFYKTSDSLANPPALVGPPLPQNAEAAIYDVHAMGNPILWWLSSAAIFLLIALLIDRLLEWADSLRKMASISSKTTVTGEFASHLSPAPQPYTWIAFYLVTNWVANLLLWVRVTRCTFLYHYMGASMFSLLAIALICDRWLQSPIPRRRAIALTFIFLILAAFIFWMPIYLGLPLTPQAIQIRRWFPSWI